MKILLSIKPEYAEKILTGEKSYEYRKALPSNREINTVVIYATKPIGKVIGEFCVGGFISEPPSRLWEITENKSGISKEFFDDYFRGRNQAHAIKVGNKKRYRHPRSLCDILGREHPPQSFCYL